jgi:hypothetical protein
MVEDMCGPALRARTRFESAAMGLRLARSLVACFGSPEPGVASLPDASFVTHALADTSRDTLGAALRFAIELAKDLGIRDDNRDEWQRAIAELRRAPSTHPLTRIARVFDSTPHGDLLADLVVLGALPEQHEAFAVLCRLLHPVGLPYPTVALALHWLEFEAVEGGDATVSARRALDARERVQEMLLCSSLDEIGLVRMEGEGPWHQRTLRVGPGVEDALQGRRPRLAAADLVTGFKSVPGLESWLAQADVGHAARALRSGEACMIALTGPTDAMRATRARALLGAAGLGAIRTPIAGDVPRDQRSRIAADAYCAAFVHGACPWIDVVQEIASAAGDVSFALPRCEGHDLPALVSAPSEQALPRFDGPILVLRIEPLQATMRRRMWSTLLPQLAPAAGVLAARYPIEPEEARAVVADLALLQRTADNPTNPLGIDDIGACLRARTANRARPGVRRVIPQADWSALLVPERATAQLTEAVLRIHQQLTVLDDWGFAQGRSDRRGLRLLFYGPPGTGKTLAAEAMARALGVDLLAVDIASLVSKWIGETEKNMAAVFEVAESSRALLLFDEADALFGRRTEVDDANDRYANLETAFLLQRLERYEGVAILATNLRNNLDAAFTRRFEFIVEFPDPDLATRERLWRLHVPRAAPLAQDVDFEELAHWFAMTGAQIRNAALGAAFLAAADRADEPKRLRRTHFLHAIEREYEKAGRAHPGNPPPRTDAGPQPFAEPAVSRNTLAEA